MLTDVDFMIVIYRYRSVFHTQAVPKEILYAVNMNVAILDMFCFT